MYVYDIVNYIIYALYKYECLYGELIMSMYILSV